MLETASPTNPEEEEEGSSRVRLPFPVVGIGASAGGMEALEALFSAMPPNTGMAFVVVLHLSPDHESHAAEILQRCTRMRVQQVHGPIELEPGHVYVIAPSGQLEMKGRTLAASTVKMPLGPRTAIDHFFRTLADVHRERAIGIVLSGMGSDGAVGVTRLKERGGVTLVQLPKTRNMTACPGLPSPPAWLTSF